MDTQPIMWQDRFHSSLPESFESFLIFVFQSSSCLYYCLGVAKKCSEADRDNKSNVWNPSVGPSRSAYSWSDWKWLFQAFHIPFHPRTFKWRDPRSGPRGCSACHCQPCALPLSYRPSPGCGCLHHWLGRELHKPTSFELDSTLCHLEKDV